MKKNKPFLTYWILALILVWLLASCATQKDGCGTENYKHKFNK